MKRTMKSTIMPLVADNDLSAAVTDSTIKNVYCEGRLHKGRIGIDVKEGDTAFMQAPVRRTHHY